MTHQINDRNLHLIEPDFGSHLTQLILELDILRNKMLFGSTHPAIFIQLKNIFHTLESIGSARIEGNNTTVEEYIETKIDGKTATSNPLHQEIQNIEKAMAFIDEHIELSIIDRAFIGELHKLVVKDLPLPPHGEGDRTPGVYRQVPIKISKSYHIPPDSYHKIEEYMNELIEFINRKDLPQYDLLKIALAHHRFLWIHPFSNGNGRTVRLFTYAMLVKYGFKVNKARILGPTTVFCSNRNNYYDYLSKADTGSREGILAWCEYVLEGLKIEIEKIDKLLDYEYLKKEILLPAINYSLERGHVNELEVQILRVAVEKQVIHAGDLKDIFKDKTPSVISNNIKKLIDKNMLRYEKPDTKTRKYCIKFYNNHLYRSVSQSLDEKGFLPIK